MRAVDRRASERDRGSDGGGTPVPVCVRGAGRLPLCLEWQPAVDTIKLRLSHMNEELSSTVGCQFQKWTVPRRARGVGAWT